MTDQSSFPIGPRVIVALDLASADAALEMARRLDPRRCRVKVGKELFTTGGPLLVTRLRAMGFEVFVDLKFHDIPNTVAAACRAAASDGAWMLDVHASGGRRMMEAAREALAPFSRRPLLVAVTVLTSMDARDLAEVGVPADPEAQVLRLALLARDSGMDGVVCSPREARLLREHCGPGFVLVTPGVRPPTAAADDQSRIATPAEAVAAGAHYLVIGRPITQAADPVEALSSIIEQTGG
ncbi:MAG: orotidine-5'-phosphate decarboxylase [Rhodocyclaceae bacterium]|nr:orotidine-5'-phosphate decarboxylase [Rhodocyclaceae bacterium]MCA3076167.1 orotidine-5'-phosphate decarboxylase [Rhodocyclaceae bacterium]MCA3089376.1 orotidine-5'-phosphate decarboxylase [Rhodocyclaceae bacterium]MCA3092937.1 orotidine-5'-phosphate decarboxylase [Rhodocyclaceae bacterium]MCA3096972.1 orotidine-5'-phosphate decarboxylase [Rhodocyclaceae bacterium]